MNRTIIIGDIHGCYHTLIGPLSRVGYDSANDNLIFLGDYIDRGLNSYEVVSAIRKLQQQVGKERVVCIRGNHEQMAIDAVENNARDLWYYNGGAMTDESFERHGEDVASFVAWFKSLPLFCESKHFIFCHAGLTEPKLEDNTQDDLLWGRDWLKSDTRKREKKVIFGHTPNPYGKAYTTKTEDICIDSACVYGGNLCALIISSNGSVSIVYEHKSQKDAEQ